MSLAKALESLKLALEQRPLDHARVIVSRKDLRELLRDWESLEEVRLSVLERAKRERVAKNYMQMPDYTGMFARVDPAQAHRAHCSGCESCTPPGSVFSEHAPRSDNETKECFDMEIGKYRCQAAPCEYIALEVVPNVDVVMKVKASCDGFVILSKEDATKLAQDILIHYNVYMSA